MDFSSFNDFSRNYLEKKVLRKWIFNEIGSPEYKYIHLILHQLYQPNFTVDYDLVP